MERKSNEELFEKLNKEEQNIYLQKARYLIEYGYMMNKDVEELAIEIYSKRRVKKS